jgi:hypothetical protein
LDNIAIGMKQFSSLSFDFQPVIIIGAARSGTNMLRDALAQLDHAATWPCDEINAIWRHRWAAFPSDELRPDHATPHVQRFVRQAFQRLAHRTKARWVVEKTCANSLRVDYISAILPQAKFVFVTRDGRDVVASAMKRWRAPFDLPYTLRKLRYVPLGDIHRYAVRFATSRWRRAVSQDRRLATWGPRFDGIDEFLATKSLAEVCAEQWSRCVLQADSSLAQLPAERVCHVSYEEFVANPTREFQRIAAFLGAKAGSQMLRRVSASSSAHSVGKWRRELDAAMVTSINPTVERTMNAIREWGAIGEGFAHRPQAA